MIIIIFLHGLGRLTCFGIDALLSFPGASTISSSSGIVFEGVFRESGVVHSFKVVDPILCLVLTSSIPGMSSSFLLISLLISSRNLNFVNNLFFEKYSRIKFNENPSSGS